MYDEIFISNNKLGGIPSLLFETALNCSSNERGYCNICGVCYALRDTKRNPHKRTKEEIAADKLTYVVNNPDLWRDVVKYIKIKNIKVIRVNISGDFTNKLCIDFLKYIAAALPGVKFYCYSKRIDLKAELIQLVKLCNVYLNSDKMEIFNIPGANQYESTGNIKKFHHAKNKCAGSCGPCGQCYSLKNAHITCFIHGPASHINPFINTPGNREYIEGLIMEVLGIKITIPERTLFVKYIIPQLIAAGIKGVEKIRYVPELLQFLDLKAAGL